MVVVVFAVVFLLVVVVLRVVVGLVVGDAEVVTKVMVVRWEVVVGEAAAEVGVVGEAAAVDETPALVVGEVLGLAEGAMTTVLS